MHIREAPPKLNLCSFGHCPNDSFPRSAAEGKWVLFRSQQRRLRLSTVAATRQQQCNLPDLQPASSHLVWPAERKHVEVFSLLAVILQFQMEATKCFGPERWAVGWVFRNGFRNKRAIVVRKELIANIRERFAHLITDVVQGDTRWNTPLILCLGDTRLEGGLKRPKGKGVYNCDFNKIKSTDFILIPRQYFLFTHQM